MAEATALPIEDSLPDLLEAMREHDAAVLVAPPGAGKTTRVPLALLDQPWLGSQKILVLEPRRIAARAAAERMSVMLGETLGGMVGLRARLSSRIGPHTRIEVITEGVFTRMILDDPALMGVGAVLFDEYHERSLDADLGLALALDAQAGLREDLRILVMSATLDGARVAALLRDAPVIKSEGRAYPVETRYLGRDPRRRIEDQVVDAIMRALRADAGSLLVFLPGQGEIRRVETILAERISDTDIDIAPLYGAMDAKAQDRAIEPAASGRRKIVLATSIAETSLTIEGVRIVIDSGLARVPRYEPDVGVTRLETIRVSRAAADQRRGRAGRTQSGICYRLWDEAANQSLQAFATPEIKAADLSGLLLDLAHWGVTDPSQLSWLDPPPQAALKEARSELLEIGAIGGDGRITERGRAISALPLPPRLARMITDASPMGAVRDAAMLAALLVERGLGGDGVDIAYRLERFQRDRSERATAMRRLAEGWARLVGERSSRPSGGASPGELLALAYPGRIARSRGSTGQFVLVNGRGVQLDPTEALAALPFLVVAEMTGTAAATRVLLAAPLEETELLRIAGDRIETSVETAFDMGAGALRSRNLRRLGAIALASEPQPVPRDEVSALALAKGIAALGINRLPWTKAQTQLRHRVAFLAAGDPDWPDLMDETLAGAAGEWLAPHLGASISLAEIKPDMLDQALDTLLPWALRKQLDRDAPTHFIAPTGNSHPIDYEGESAPMLTIRVQELFGLKEHPSIAQNRHKLTLQLVSPAHRPIQITRDLPGFWAGSWALVRSEMRGRYPRHPWPDDPANASPTARAKPRGT